MRITSSAISLTVADAAASATFLTNHFGFTAEMQAEGFASLSREDAGMNIVFLSQGLPTMPTEQRDQNATGVIVAFVVDDLEGELARLEAEGVEITMPLTVEEWGERAFQVLDPNGVIIQLVDWKGTASTHGVLDPGPFFHGTKAALNPGDLLEAHRPSNFGTRKEANFVYLTSVLETAVWGAELALGEGPGRIYQVEPIGQIENDPNLTDKKIPGNPTKSYRTRQPLRVVGEVREWEGHSPQVLQSMVDQVAKLKQLGIESIND
ncbi:MAG: NAD(+)--rifampin ADP-ribosyltransferase [Propionibacteriaceae bacterium]|jgi:rifampin ADP-ribosylating transferase|nr:NAD(+)--rifampin ADP-ribosyltransferase [Propionibacteriaceae bacterium]